MPSTDALAEYHRKRDFRRTAEPKGSTGPGGRPEPSFVVQIHDATAMHFDFRLEVDGVLKSWAVPKGPSADPHDKRLAMPTEDHPLDYADFEGVIAEGEYGGGTVIIWDEGTYHGLATDRRGREIPFADALRDGHASFCLHGGKLRGGYALTRTRPGGDGQREAWLLVKKNDRHASSHHATEPRRARSARTGRTLKRVAADAAASGPSKR
ncbi:DNA ligase D-like protein (predicted 3'-phosphoesterase) [Streptomyces sp. V4I23]|uniref:DNA polymerase ligase N-terminal domain-containing protein n=1 Tax=Streptomyces sp. V4I23 TaxID=3042282 RepID=UPI002787A930|nr:DNA polymerase ligase N-terminal domain-containing protein [Streptomyces sp. V4I23]MDQ1006433.1 DNA ligase D-like protein (predicted 3'-phosphoesterase) [Streptomyces sp. V4I23]